MAQNRAIIHHFVPQVLQGQFTFEPKKIWYSMRGIDGKFRPPKVMSTKNAFQIRDLYTVTVNGEPSDVVETKFYGKIDNYLGKIIPSATECFANNEIPTFDGQPLDSLRDVVFEMAKRTPDFTGADEATKLGRSFLEEVLADDSGALTPDERKKYTLELSDHEALERYGREIITRASVNRMPRAKEAMSDMTAHWAVSETRHSFILSSTMAYRIGNGGPNGLSNPDMEIWMPITPKLCIVLARDPMKRYPLRYVCSPDHIRQINEYGAACSQQIASHSPELLRSIIG